MRWIDKYKKKKEEEFKRKYSQITLEDLCFFFLKFLKKEGLLQFYIANQFIMNKYNIFYYKDWFFYHTFRNLGYSYYLNERTIEDIFELYIFNGSKYNKNIVISEFISFLKENNYSRYIPINKIYVYNTKWKKQTNCY